MWVKDSQRSDIQYWAPAANSAGLEPPGAPPPGGDNLSGYLVALSPDK